jgi:hypothetical protein
MFTTAPVLRTGYGACLSGCAKIFGMCLSPARQVQARRVLYTVLFLGYMVAGHVVNRSEDEAGDGDPLILQWCSVTVTRTLALVLIAFATAHTLLVASLVLAPSAHEGSRHYQWFIALLHLPGVFPLRLGVMLVARGFVRAHHSEYGAPGTAMRMAVELAMLVPTVWHLMQARGLFTQNSPSTPSAPGRGRLYPQPTYTFTELTQPDPNLRRDPSLYGGGNSFAGVPMSKLEADPQQIAPVLTAVVGAFACVSFCLFAPHRLAYVLGAFPLCEGSLVW